MMKGWKALLHFLGFSVLLYVGIVLVIARVTRPEDYSELTKALMGFPLALWVVVLWNWVDRKKAPDHYTMIFENLSSEELDRAREYVEGNARRSSAPDPERAKRIAEQRLTWGTHKPKVRPEDGEAS